MSDWTPHLPPPKPPIARQHCRHYSYGFGLGPDRGPGCAAGVNNSEAGGVLPCMPDPKVPCPSREDWTSEERQTWRAWQEAHMVRMLTVMAEIPSAGFDGQMQCPGCGVGTLRWTRARSNRHLHAACSTPNCFQVIQ